MSLDHDLNLEHYRGDYTSGTGNDVVQWLEAQLMRGVWTHPVPKIHIHTQSPEGWKRMSDTVQSIRRLRDQQS